MMMMIVRMMMMMVMDMVFNDACIHVLTCKTNGGKDGDGSEVSHNRKFGCKVSSLNSSHIFSSVGIHDIDK